MKRPLPDQYLTPEDLVILFRLPSVETVYQWRRKGVGPRSFRVGRYVRFDPEVVRAWVESQMAGAA
ncbi:MULTISPECIES: helix-turn-helix transcriptional regulator [Streptomyces violaceusniger group]|uniref:Helix-turn-helix domain-containing protein n=1 Tax=Streptomyces rhizosphaericus TaxID=114699 RepID=A0A6G4AN53_9ACTN|nr:helix-turn-helix domain-containing protein [Streptomyces rhizosphaericus]NEW73917.1 helix-turn-helix domain-containing protein [Streptomyces rhizosphaericus]